MTKPNVAILSTGNVEQDQEALARFIEREDRIKAGMCPNGCGGMVETDAHNAECPKCGFGYFCAAGLHFRVANRA